MGGRVGVHGSEALVVSGQGLSGAGQRLVERFAQGHPLADSDRDTYYAGHTQGYTDYPAFTAN
ncbi:hypothetical protein OG539_01780 [Actinacidiphila glaucinigra]|uniref:hypothetical protein n=1 Tax=Actinacidiphila glaucinigra TaxID=235986 RepID=UPI00324E82F2